MKRVCLFAGYSAKGIIEDYVLYYIKELNKHADVYYCADCEIKPTELKKIAPYTKKMISFHHGKYDFGSWSELFKFVQNLKDYDELILTNDSVYGPLYPLENIFHKMDEKDISAWSICANKYMMSFFLVLKKEVFLSAWFKNFILNIEPILDKGEFVRMYENGFSKLIEEHHLKWKALFSAQNIRSLYKENLGFIRQALKNISFYLRWIHRYRLNKLHIYDDDFFILLLLGMPLIKKRAFELTDNHFHKYAPLFIKSYTDYDYNLILKSIQLNNLHPKHESGIKKFLLFLGHIVFDTRGKGNDMIYRIFKIPVYKKPYVSELLKKAVLKQK